ncbi:hypothetical protein MY5147_000094 [Beauveria neobassiana]
MAGHAMPPPPPETMVEWDNAHILPLCTGAITIRGSLRGKGWLLGARLSIVGRSPDRLVSESSTHGRRVPMRGDGWFLLCVRRADSYYLIWTSFGVGPWLNPKQQVVRVY